MKAFRLRAKAERNFRGSGESGSNFRTFEAQDEAAKSGNRPRFKRAARKINFALEPMQTNCAGVGGSLSARKQQQQQQQRRRVTARKSSLIIIKIIALLAPLSSIANINVNCDQEMGADLQNRELIRVAAVSSKLEQWFTCRHLALELSAASYEAGAGAGSGSFPHPHSTPQAALPKATGCQATFDGHLCWPATGAGQEARLPCPRMNWLPSQPKKELDERRLVLSVSKSVISAIQLAANNSGNFLNASQPTNNKSIIKQANFGLAPNERNFSTVELIEAKANERFARRTCLQLEENHLSLRSELNQSFGLLAAHKGQWALEANYSDCYTGESGLFDPTDEWIKLDQEPDKRLFLRLVDELDRIEGAIDPYSDPDLQEQWRLCISNIMHQFEPFQPTMRPRPNTAAQAANASDLWCPIIFDGWRCWPSTKAGQIAYVSCPKNQPGFSAEREAHKICTSNGTWYKHPMTNRYWSNYTTCVDTVDLAFRTKILNLYVIGNLISLVALSASLIIFISFKSLNCTRVTIHKNLFLSFITNNLMWIIWYTYVVNDADLLQSNPIQCQLWHILLHYFLVSNYFWMFCEGLYLHTLLVVAFVSEDKILKWFYLLGWLTPIPITVAYAYNRSYDEYYTHFCWMEESPHNFILMAPIGISLLLNLIFLINIVRVLVTKLRANNSPDTHQTRKAVRATLILIPLLGLHYILTPFRPEAKSEWEGIYECIAAVCTSFQGLCVAMLFCFCNGEVMAVIKKKLKDSFNVSHHNTNGEQMRSRSNTATTGASCHTLQAQFNYQPSSNNNHNHNHQQQQQRVQQPITGSNNHHNHLFNNEHSKSSSLITTITSSPIQSIKNESLSPNKTICKQTLLDQASGGCQLNIDLAEIESSRPLVCNNNNNNNLQTIVHCNQLEETIHLLKKESINNQDNQDCSNKTTSFSVAT